VYDKDNSNTITKENMLNVLREFVKVRLLLMEKEFGGENARFLAAKKAGIFSLVFFVSL